ncbi:MAG: ABC transporter substrate-binding protein [Lachnospiraceae bacterium]|nr:ABC transporter substrate-binding protein [Lachnospiraceae bacterium]
MKITKRLTAVLLSGSLALSMLAGSAACAEETETPEEVTLNIAYMPNYAALWAVLTGIEKGYFEEEGLTLNLYEFADGPTEIAAMESGTIDLAYIGNGAHKLCITGSAVIFALQQVDNSDSIIVNTSHGIESLEDLAGKKIGYASGTSSESSLLSALDYVGLTWDDIEPYEMEATNFVSAMVSESIDAVTAWSPYTLQILNELEDAQKIEFDNGTVSIASWIALPDYAEENEDILLRFTRALYKAYDYGSQEENYEEVAQLVADQCATDYDTALAQTEDATWYNQELIRSGLEDGTIRDLYQSQQDTFIRDEAVEEEVPLDDYILFDIMEAAME